MPCFSWPALLKVSCPHSAGLVPQAARRQAQALAKSGRGGHLYNPLRRLTVIALVVLLLLLAIGQPVSLTFPGKAFHGLQLQLTVQGAVLDSQWASG